MAAQDATTGIAKFIRAMSLSEVDAHVQERAAIVIVDTIAAILAGTKGDVAEPLRCYIEPSLGKGDAAIYWWDVKVPGEIAAFVNGTLGHALDFDDVVSLIPAHPSAVVIAALLAAKPGADLTGAELLESYIVGVEVAAKIGKGIGLGHYNQGYHATGTIAIFGAIAAVAKLLELDEFQTRYALGIGVSMAAGLQVNFGTMTKPAHTGWAAKNALVAAQLAQCGWTSSESALDGKEGFFTVYGTEKSSTEEIVSWLANPYLFEDPGVALKQYPCCYAVHRAVDGVRGMLKGPAKIDEIKAISCSVPPTGLRPLLYKRPKTGLEGKFSMEYALAATVLDGTLNLNSFEDDQVLRPEIAELYERISVQEEERNTVGDGTVRTTSAGTIGFVGVTIDFTDGHSETATVYKPKGAPTLPFDWNDIREKFFSCASVAGVPVDAANQVMDGLQNLANVEDVNALLSLAKASGTAA
jgi:2-methylcitrate dehydratase PrpD